MTAAPVRRPRRTRLLVACALTVLLLAPLVWFWQASLLPDEYSVMDMGYADYGGGNAQAHPHTAPSSGDDAGTSVASLTGPRDGEPDVSVTLAARREPVQLEGGPAVDGYTLNGTSPGPTITATVGDLVEVRLVNESVPDGVTLHWHGVDVPNAEDGVAGVTQDAVATGGEHVYRFVAEDPGTYWYHSHQVSHEQVRGGLFGALVIAPMPGGEAMVDAPALVHTYDGYRTVNGVAGDAAAVVAAGSTARVRVVNTNEGAIRAWVNGAPFRVVAVDGRDLVGPTPLTDVAVEVGGGGRVDLAVDVPEDGSAVRVGTGGGGASLVVGPQGSRAPEEHEPEDALDLLGYGSPSAPSFEPDDADRVFEYDIGRRPGFLDGRPGLWWTINGHLFPDVPMYVVAEGDVVRMEISNGSGQVHPMHLHGHHALVLSRDGEAATGSPLWIDSLNVADGESYEIAFVADNPGVWMDHCHNLQHAAEGLVAHLAYEGVTTPFTVGGEALNRPE